MPQEGLSSLLPADLITLWPCSMVARMLWPGELPLLLCALETQQEHSSYINTFELNAHTHAYRVGLGRAGSIMQARFLSKTQMGLPTAYFKCHKTSCLAVYIHSTALARCAPRGYAAHGRSRCLEQSAIKAITPTNGTRRPSENLTHASSTLCHISSMRSPDQH